MSASINALNLMDKFSISPELAQDLIKIGTIRKVKKGAVLFLKGETPKSLVLTLEGMFGVQPVLEEGKDHTFNLYGNGTILNDAFMNNTETRVRNSDVKCIIESIALFVPISKANHLVQTSIEFNQMLHRSLSKKLHGLASLVFIRKEKDPIERVRQALELLGSEDKNCTVHLNYSELGALINTSRNTVARVVNKMEAEKKLRRNSHGLEITRHLHGDEVFSNLTPA